MKKEQFENIYNNLLSILYNRKWITKNEMNHYKTKIVSNIFNTKFILKNLEYKIKNEIVIHFVTDKAFLKKKNIFDIIESEKKHIIIIINDDIYNKSNNDLFESKHIEVWKSSELYFDLMKFIFVPKHEKLIFKNDDDRKIFLEQFNIKEEQMPQMLSTSPMSKYLNAFVNDIVEIHRIDEPNVYKIVRLDL